MSWDLFKAWLAYQRRFLSLRYRQGEPENIARMLAADGYMTEKETRFLYRLASEQKEGCIVEIGTFHGRSTIALVLGAQSGMAVPVYAIDPFVTFRGPLGWEFGPADRVGLLKNLLLAGVGEYPSVVNLTSEQAARGWRMPISLLWIDGDHSYEGVKTDWDSWAPFLVTKGRVAFHDSHDLRMGVARLIGQVLERGGYSKTDVVDKITVLQKL